MYIIIKCLIVGKRTNNIELSCQQIALSQRYSAFLLYKGKT